MIDVQTERRNFPGYTEAQLCTLVDLQQGDTSGTTDTDSQTDPPYPGYTRLNKALTGRKGQSMGGTKLTVGTWPAESVI